MFDNLGETLYVGKAKQLRNRLRSYFRDDLDSVKTRLLVSKIADIEVTLTTTESEALILEQNLINTLKPRYNILLRDDKSYPYIALNEHAKFPRLFSYRGVRRKDHRYFGPFPNTYAVKESLEILQKLFGIRSCTDTFFTTRTRPCLQYQIKRCTAPCVNFITQEIYRENINKAVLFLEGKSQELIQNLQQQMNEAAQQLQYEKAMHKRDQIAKLKQVQEQQFVMGAQGHFDIIVITQRLGYYSLIQQSVRDGKLLGNKQFFQKAPLDESLAEIVYAFIAQFYLTQDVLLPNVLLVNVLPTDLACLSDTLSVKGQHKVKITKPEKGEKLRWVELTCNSAEQLLWSKLQEKLSQKDKLQTFAQALGFVNIPQRIECFDISHQQGEATVASCVVFGEEGAIKAEYRKFNIEGITPGDDYAALKQAITRRYTRRLNESAPLPDLLIIDGGKGQLKQALDVKQALNIADVSVISISKGPGRNPQFDILWLENQDQPLHLPADSIALHYVQQIRDEAHRFAILGHRNARDKKRVSSILEQVEGIGHKRRRDLLKHFGGLQKLQAASVEEIAKVPGISALLAKRIYDTLHA